MRKRLLSLFTAGVVVAGALLPCNPIFAEEHGYPDYDYSLSVPYEVLVLSELSNIKYEPEAVDAADFMSRLDTYDERFAVLLGTVCNPELFSDTDMVNNAITATTSTLTNPYSSEQIDLKHMCVGETWEEIADSLTDGTDYDFELLHFSSLQEASPELVESVTNVIIEFCAYYEIYRPAIAQSYSESKKMTASEAKNLAGLAKVIEYNKTLCPELPKGIVSAFTYWWSNAPEGSMSLRDLYEESLNLDLVQADVSALNTVYTQPLADFYSVNDVVTWTDVLHPYASELTNYVSLGSNVIQGIAYSASFVPMQTNLYGVDTLAQFDSDFLMDFHYKYGFMRKALYRDTSASAAVDYYTSSGSAVRNLEVCTLRDLLEAGDKDTVLYIGSNLYNSDEASAVFYDELSSYRAFLESSEMSLSEFLTNLRQGIASSNTADSTDTTTTQNTPKSPVHSIVSTFTESVNILAESLRLVPDKVSADSFDAMSTQLGISRALSYTDLPYWEEFAKEDRDSYSESIRSNLTSIGLSEKDGDYKPDASEDNRLLSDNLDAYVMSSYKIKDYLDCTTAYTAVDYADEEKTIETFTYDDYTPGLGAAYISAIYRDPYAFSASNYASRVSAPVFMASDDFVKIPNAEQYYKNSLLNYALLRNLPSMAQVSYTYVLDLDSPVYMDIYGNIVTENGTVVIPAAANATLFPDDYNVYAYSLALPSCYGRDYYIPGTLAGADDVIGMHFTYSSADDVWLLMDKNVTVDEENLNMRTPSLYTDATRNVLYKAFMNYLCQDNDESNTHCIWVVYVNLINEVMRGAPVSMINKVDDIYGDSSPIDIAKLLAAAKLEVLQQEISKGDIVNTLIAIPNLSTIEHLDFIIALLLKLLVVLVIGSIFYVAARDCLASAFGFKSVFKILKITAIAVIAVVGVPALFQLTYYSANKVLLQDAAAEIAMYNLEKDESGIEVGITSTELRDDSTELLIQLDWLEIPWYDKFEQILFSSAHTTIDNLREEAAVNSLVSGQGDVIIYNDGVYMNAEDVFGSVDIDYTFLDQSTSEVNGMYLYADYGQQTLSFYNPYYVFLKALVSDVNSYNYANNVYSYTTKYMSGNRLKTVGLCEEYFTSEAFMKTGVDLMHLYEIYNVDDPTVLYARTPIFDSESLDKMSQSLWYCARNDKVAKQQAERMDKYARDFVAKHHNMLSKVSDETFLKIMAMSLALDYNKTFGIPVANCYEIYNLDTSDLMRLCLVDTESAMLASPLSFARFVYSYGGETTIYASALLMIIMYLGSFLKPLFIMVAYGGIVINVIWYKVILQKDESTTRGFFVSVLALSATNLLHAVLLKVATILPNIGIPILGCTVAMIIMQIAYLLILSYLVGVTLSHWQDLGYSKHVENVEKIREKVTRSPAELNQNVPRHTDNWDYYNDLVNQHRERRRR